MLPTRGAAVRLAPENGSAAPTANRDGVIFQNAKKPLGSASALNKYEAQSAPSTGKVPGPKKEVHRLVRIWPAQLRRLKDKRYGDGPIPDDETSRRLVAIMLDLLVQRLDGRREALDFLPLFCPWMAPAECADAVDSAIRRNKFWTSATLADALALTWEEHEDCCPAIRPAGATNAEMAAARTMKNTAGKRKKRQQATPLPKKGPLSAIRAKVIADVLMSGERCTVRELCETLNGRTDFRGRKGHWKGRSLQTAIRNAIREGVAMGILRHEVEQFPQHMPISWVTKAEVAPVLYPSAQAADTEKCKHKSPVRSGCGQEKSASTKNLSAPKILIIEEGLPASQAVGRPRPVDIWATGEWDAPDAGDDRVALSAPPATKTVIDGLVSPKTGTDRKKDDRPFPLQGDGK